MFMGIIFFGCRYRFKLHPMKIHKWQRQQQHNLDRSTTTTMVCKDLGTCPSKLYMQQSKESIVQQHLNLQ